MNVVVRETGPPCAKQRISVFSLPANGCKSMFSLTTREGSTMLRRKVIN